MISGVSYFLGDPKMKVIELLNKLSTARMEYQSSSHSVLNNFVVPYFIDNCDLRASSHSIALVGSRGSGKSTYIRHFSHSTRFDPRRNNIDNNEFDCIILYWKPDTAYCQGLVSEWLGEHAVQFFMLHTALSLLDEVCSMLINVSSHFPDVLNELDANGNLYIALSNITKAEIKNINDVRKWIRTEKYDVSTRLNPVNTDGLISIEPQSMLNYIIDSLRDDCSLFNNTIFKIFVDEFELLTVDQQKLINTYRKESKKTLNWNVAYKSNASPSTETTSDQWLQKPDDYREHDIDDYIRADYPIYAAEIFILTLQNAGLNCQEIQLTPEFLGNRENLVARRDSTYRTMVNEIVRNILPTPSTRQLSENCLNSDIVNKKLRVLGEELKLNSDILNSIIKDASLAITFLGTSKQKSFEPELFVKYVSGDKSVVSKINDKVHSYELNTLLSLNLQNPTLQVPVYAGFDKYLTMTIPNVRHFKELCYSAIRHFYETTQPSDVHSIKDIPSITYSCMHDAAIATSGSLVKEVISYPPHGNKLSQMVNRIGELFKISQKSAYQTEPERVIFSIEYDFAGDDRELEDFIRSAKSWRVLIVDDSKRIKNDLQLTSQEFQLNPIYSPKFGISIRKKRGIVFTVDQFKCLISGNNTQYLAMRKSYQKKWKVDEVELKQGLLL
jgi:hypothetical protein